MSQKAPGIGPEHEEQGNNQNEASKCTDHATSHWRNQTFLTLFMVKTSYSRPERQPPKTDSDRSKHDRGDMKAPNRNGDHADA